VNIAEQIASNCAEARRRAGLSQAQLAYRLITASQEISRIESGRTCPRLTTLLRLAHALDVPLADLIKGIE
jgi:transcriptional regulator with XRE-family HTH domain